MNLNERIAKIKSFKNLEEGWDSYNSETIRPEAIEMALKLNLSFDESYFVSPLSDGGIMFESDDLTVSIEIGG